MVIRGIAKGKSIEFDHALPFSDGEAVHVTIEKAPREGVIDAVLRVIHEPPHLSREDIDALNKSLDGSRVAMSTGNIFGHEAA